MDFATQPGRRFRAIDVLLTAGLVVVAGAFVWLLAWRGGLQADAEAAVKALLKDPESARFERVQTDNASKMVCGFVNGRNGFGGYVGFRPFFYTPGAGAYILTKDEDLHYWRSFFDRCPQKLP